MLLPDNIHPELSVFYNGAIVLSSLNKNLQQKILDLYFNVKKINNMSFSVFVLSLDWLYLIDAAEIDGKGIIRKCL
jgi:hypothetical protein